MGQEWHILIVNTSVGEWHNLAQVWQMVGRPVRVKEVRTRDAFLEALQAEMPDVVLNICLFPELDGLSALQLSQQAAANVPFVMLGEKRTSAEEMCIAAGAAAFFERGEETKLAEWIRSLNAESPSAAAETQARRTVAMLIEPLSLRLKVEKMLHKRSDVKVVPLLRGMQSTSDAPELLIAALNELTPFPNEQVATMPVALLATEETEDKAIDYLRRGALGYTLIEMLTEKRLGVLLDQALQQLEMRRLYTEHRHRLEAMHNKMQSLEQRCEMLDEKYRILETALNVELHRAERLKTELVRQEQALEALTKENREQRFWLSALERREQRFRKMIEHSIDMMMLLDGQSTIVYESSVAERLLGYSSEELIGHSLFELVHPAEREVLQAEFLRHIRKMGTVPTMRLQMQHKSGEWRYIELVASNLLHDEAVQAIIVNLRDITDRVQVEKELQRAKDEFENRVIERTRDLIELSRKLQEEIAERRRIEKTLQESEDYFWTIFRLSPAAILLCRAEDGTILNANAAFESLANLSYEDAIGRTIEQVGLQLSTEALGTALMKKGTSTLSNLETEMIAKTGERRSILAAAQAIELRAQPCWLIILQDVTERKRVEESLEKSLAEKEVLLKEIHHRVKNNLQVVSSLLYLQAMKLTDEKAKEIFRESQNRIKSMALIHEQLYQSKDFSEINFAEYLCDLVSMLAESYTVSPSLMHVKTDTDSLRVSINAAVPAGLIVSELVTNSLKYAFPEGIEANGKEKKITIFATKNAESEIILEVRDNGIGFGNLNPIEAPKSLGLRLVKMLTEQLHGKLAAYNENGAVFRISFKDNS